MIGIVETSVIQNYLGRISYDDGLLAQNVALAQLSNGRNSAVVLGLEHERVITLGVRGRVETDIEATPAEIAREGFSLVQTTRGGQATLHAPGQLVIYPCVNLRAFELGARTFVELVQATTMEWLLSHGVAAEVGAHEPGLFVEGRKLAAFGFKISHGLTSHGLALNVSNRLEDFELIRTCGVDGQKVTRLQDLGVETDLEALFLSWVQVFRANLTPRSS